MSLHGILLYILKIYIFYTINNLDRPEYDVKLLQEGRTVRVLLHKNRYAPAPVNGGPIEITDIRLNVYGQYKNGRFFYRR